LVSFGAEYFVLSLLYKSIKIKIYRTVILPAILYGCETWSLTLSGACRLSVFENRVLRKIFGAERDEVKGEWRNLHNDELIDLYCSPNIVRVIKSRRMRWAGHVAHTGTGEVRAVRNYPTPKCVKDVRAFLGLASFYRRLVPNFAELAKSLTTLTKKNQEFSWGPCQQEAFQSLKDRLCTTPVLAFPDFKLPFMFNLNFYLRLISEL
jgi:hypothetical protein